jgi:hypothetical protein
MTDHKTGLRGLDHLPTPDLQDDIDVRLRRLQEGEILVEPSPFPGAHVRIAKGAVTGLALALLAAAGMFIWRVLPPNARTPPASLAPGQIFRVQLPDTPEPIAAGEGAAWVVVSGLGSSENTDVLWRIDAATYDAKALPNTRGAESPAVGEGAAWVTCMGEENPCGGPSVLKLNPRIGRTLAVIRLPGTPWDIATGLGAVWVASPQGLAKIDPETARLIWVSHAPPKVEYDSVGTAGGAVWATSTDTERGAVYQIDPADGRVIQSIPQRDPCILDASGDAVWVATCRAGVGGFKDELTKIDARDGRVVFRSSWAGYGEIQAVGRSLFLTRRKPQDQSVIELVRLDPASGHEEGIVASISPVPFVTRRRESTSEGLPSSSSATALRSG